MREIGLLLAGLLIPQVSHAAGLIDFVRNAGDEASGYVYSVLAILATGLIGIIGVALLSMFGKSKVAKLLENGSYVAAVAIFLGMAMTLFKKFVNLVFG